MVEYKGNLPEFKLIRKDTDYKKIKISCSKDAAEYAHNFYGSDISMFESFFILLLNNANNTIGYVKISQGGITGTIVDIRIILKYAIESLATGVILIHNHPSGTLKPSEADKSITSKAKQALEYMDIKVLDHVIIVPKIDGEIKYMSFSDENIL